MNVGKQHDNVKLIKANRAFHFVQLFVFCSRMIFSAAKTPCFAFPSTTCSSIGSPWVSLLFFPFLTLNLTKEEALILWSFPPIVVRLQ